MWVIKVKGFKNLGQCETSPTRVQFTLFISLPSLLRIKSFCLVVFFNQRNESSRGSQAVELLLSLSLYLSKERSLKVKGKKVFCIF